MVDKRSVQPNTDERAGRAGLDQGGALRGAEREPEREFGGGGELRRGDERRGRLGQR